MDIRNAPLFSFTLTVTLTVMGCTAPGSRTAGAPSAESMTVPRYTEEGELIRPEGFRTWVFVGASIGLSYSEEKKREGPGRLHHVHMQPEAYEHYASTGQFPEKTMFVLTLYEPEQKKSINQQGYFSGDFVALEVALKDHERFEEGWAYFDFGKDKRAAKAFPKSRCHSCHAAHGADDNVFVQFYPALRRLKAGID